jgi:SLOG family YspA-like protein
VVILCCGDRNWTNAETILTALSRFANQEITVIHGNASGADRMSALIASKLGFKVIAFTPDWNLYGRSAGPIRNRKMLVEGKPDLVLAFHNDLEKSKGTKNMVNQARRKGVKVEVIRHFHMEEGPN